MNLKLHQENVQNTVIKPMLSYMAELEDCDYTKEDVENCGALLLDYLKALAEISAPTNDSIMKQVKKVVLALNDLNEKTDYALIETGEREAICEVIQDSAIDCGLVDPSDDITEEWREW